MADFTIIDGDVIIWEPQFGTAVTLGNPQGNVVASARKTWVTGKPPALLGDEARWHSREIAYTDGAYSIPGKGMAWIVKLGADQVTEVNQCETKAVVIRGTLFTARFEVTSPAMKPTSSGPVPDPKLVKTGGRGRLVNANKTVTMA